MKNKQNLEFKFIMTLRPCKGSPEYEEGRLCCDEVTEQVIEMVRNSKLCFRHASQQVELGIELMTLRYVDDRTLATFRAFSEHDDPHDCLELDDLEE